MVASAAARRVAESVSPGETLRDWLWWLALAAERSVAGSVSSVVPRAWLPWLVSAAARRVAGSLSSDV